MKHFNKNRPALALGFLLLTSCAYAQPETDRRELRRQLRSSCDFWGNCTKYWEYYRPARRYREPAERVYAFRRSEPSHPRCLDRISAVGEERQGTERAQEEAVRKWSNAVRFDIGVRYMDLQNADDITYECVQSSTGERTSEKLSAAIGREALMQCQIRAIPCRAKKEHGDERR